MKEIVEGLSKFPDLLKEIYGDLAKPGVSQIGKAVGGIIGLGNTILLPIHILNERSKIFLENNLEKYRLQTENIELEDVVEVPPEVGVPILEKLTHVSNEELSDMYVNLLAKASSHKAANQAHPSFVNLISSLSPDEAGFLKILQQTPAIPFIEIRLLKQEKNEWVTLADYVVHSSVTNGLTYRQNIASYLSNLDSLGIIKIRRDIFCVPPEQHYNPIWTEQEKMWKQVAEQMPEHKLTYEKARADITPFGQLFISACLTKLSKPNQ